MSSQLNGTSTSTFNITLPQLPDPVGAADGQIPRTSSSTYVLANLSTLVQAIIAGQDINGIGIGDVVGQVPVIVDNGGTLEAVWTALDSQIIDDANALNQVKSTWSRSKIATEITTAIAANNTAIGNQLLPASHTAGQIPVSNGTSFDAATPTNASYTFQKVDFSSAGTILTGGTPPIAGFENICHFLKLDKFVWFNIDCVNHQSNSLNTGISVEMHPDTITGLPLMDTSYFTGVASGSSFGTLNVTTINSTGQASAQSNATYRLESDGKVKIIDTISASTVRRVHITGTYIAQ